MTSIPSLEAHEERQFLFECVRSYDCLGFPGLALEMIRNYKLDVVPEFILKSNVSKIEESVGLEPKDQGASLDWSSPPVTSNNATSGLDWGELESKPAASGGLDWGELESKPAASGGLDWGELDSKPAAPSGLDWGELEPATEAPIDGLDDTSEVPEIKPTEPINAATAALLVSESGALALQVQSININVFKKILVMRILHVGYFLCFLIFEGFTQLHQHD